MALNHGGNKFKPAVCSIDEIDDKNDKQCENEIMQKQQQQQVEGSETAPLTRNQQKSSFDDNCLKRSDMESISIGTATVIPSTTATATNGKRGRISLDTLMEISRKSRYVYVTTACLCAVLLVIVIMLLAFWPDVPFYLKAELCVEKECVLASQQILLWSNTSADPCHNTYNWACGNFRREYEQGDYFVMKKGEWDFVTYSEYEELKELNRFISMLPTSRASYSVESMISNLYQSCREIDTLDKSQSDLLLKKAINFIDGWQAFRDAKRLQFWDYKKALVHVQTIYGVFPYFRISIENRYSKPYDYIITIDEGEIGLPDKYFYNIDNNNEIVVAYKMLLRDFAINMGIVTQEANLFADQVFHYEKRIVNHIAAVQSSNERKVNIIQTIEEIKLIAPSLPILESLQVIFPHMKISDETEILVRDIDVLREMSIVISTSDKIPINNFIIWSLAKNFLPHLSKEYRILIENFEHAVYGRTATYPRWLACTKLVRDWLPFAVDALQQNPGILELSQNSFEYSRPKSNVFPNKTYGNDEFLRLMYYTLRNQVQNSIDEVQWIDRAMKIYINEKLTTMRLQIGIPEEILNTKSYINEYYENLLLNNLFFVEHLESIWSFRKLRMEEKLKSLSIIDMIISEMYTAFETKTITYSTALNMMVISKDIAATKYYDYRFPIPVNFARIGTDIVENLIKTISVFVEQFKAEVHLTTNSSYYQNFNFVQIGEDCLQLSSSDNGDEPQELLEEEELHDLSQNALKNFHSTLSGAKITAKALSTFIDQIDNGYSIIGASIDPELTYEKLMLTHRHRIPGFRSFNENELFTLAYMQKHCSTSIADKDYSKIKPHVEKKLAERYLFDATWKHVQFLARSASCAVNDVRCPNIL